MDDKLGRAELDIKVECGAIMKELDPSVPPEKEIYRYRHLTIRGTTAKVVRHRQQMKETTAGEEVVPPARDVRTCVFISIVFHKLFISRICFDQIRRKWKPSKKQLR